jgi:hypothetical protein
MKKIIFLFAGILIANSAFTQNKAGKADDAGRIAINAYVPKGMGDMTATASQALQKRLDRIVTKNGVGGSALNQRFVMTANAIELTKDITPTTPPIYSYELEINLLIGDVVTGTKFAATAITRKGSGKSETKAYMRAIKSIAPQSKKYADFLEEGKTKIMEYYNANCDLMLKEASTLGDQKKYDEAISKLVAVPDVCKECYDKAMDQSTLIYKAKMENECQENISQAKASIAKDDWEGAANFIAGYTPDLQCYAQVEGMLVLIKDHKCADALGKAQAAWANRDSRKASNFLIDVPTDSKCAADAKALSNEIASKLDADEKKEWENKLKQQDNKFELEKANIERMRAVGVAAAKNQPKTIIKRETVVRGWFY